MIQYRKGICVECNDDRTIVNRSRMLCARHNDVRLKEAKPKPKQRVKEPNIIPGLRNHSDTVFSIFIRTHTANEAGRVKCYTCDAVIEWRFIQCGHFCKRTHTATRYMEANCKPQCKHCNETLDGNDVVFRENLVKEYGEDFVTKMERLKNVETHFTADDYRNLIDHYSEVNKEIFKKKNLR